MNLLRKIDRRRFAACVAAAAALATAAYADEPSGDAYIESAGDCFVSLAYRVGPHTKVEVDFQLLELAEGRFPFGSWGDGEADPLFEMYLGDSGDGALRFSWECSANDGSRQAANLNVADLGRRTISFDCSTATYESFMYSGEPEESYAFPKPVLAKASSVPLSVFATALEKSASTAADFMGAVRMKVYGVKIHESGALVRNFTPCLKGGIPGFKDLCGGAFITGTDISKVRYGGDIAVERDDGHIDLPSLVSTGEDGCWQFVTGYVPGPSTRIVLDYALLTPEWPFTPYYSILSARETDVWIDSDGAYAFTLGGEDYYTYGSSRGEVARMSIATAYGIRRTVSIGGDTIEFSTAGCPNAVATGAALTGSASADFRIGCAWTGQKFLPLRVYGLKFYEGETLAKDYVPFVTNGVPGLVNALDAADRLFPIDWSETRIGVAGGDFNAHTGAAESEAYLEFDGESGRIDTGVVVGSNSVVEADFSLWDSRNPDDDAQVLLLQDGPEGILAQLYINSERKFSYQYRDFTENSPVNTQVAANNFRKRFTFDGPNSTMTIEEGGSVLYSQPMTGTRTRTEGWTTLKIGSSVACMRLYGFKVTTAGETVRDYVPYSTNGVAGLYDICTGSFTPLAGATVSGAKHRGVAFQVEPRPAKVTKKENDTPTLHVVAAGAQSYEWYADGMLVAGETNDTLTVNWKKLKKAPYQVTYSVVPVYTVFGEPLKGDAATTTVTMPPKGTALVVK